MEDYFQLNQRHRRAKLATAALLLFHVPLTEETTLLQYYHSETVLFALFRAEETFIGYDIRGRPRNLKYK